MITENADGEILAPKVEAEIMPALMTIDEARAHVVAVKNAAADMGRHLLELKEREGWRVLGYSTWTAFLDSEFEYSRRHLYNLMNAAPVVERLGTTVHKLSTDAAVALSHFDEQLQPVILQTAQARYGDITESNVTRVGTVIQDMVTTGHVDVGNGTATPIDAALDLEDYEAHQRQNVYIAEKQNGRHKPKSNYSADEDTPDPRDQCQTPPYAIDPLLPYLPHPDCVIWEPAAGEGLLTEALYDCGYSNVTVSDAITGQNFFEYAPDVWDCIVTNPPFSLKYKWLERCYALGKPFALLLPVETLGAASAQVLFREYGIEVIFMSPRIDFKMPNEGWNGGGAQFPSAWFCWRLMDMPQMTFVDISVAKRAFVEALR